MRELTAMRGPAGPPDGVGELTTSAVHEINNPLMAILGLTELLLADAEPGSNVEKRLELIHSSGMEIRNAVRRLADQARQQSA